VAVFLVVMAGIGAFIAQRTGKKEEAEREKKELRQVLLLLSAAATLLMLRPSSIFWLHLPKLAFMQFPWRWMGILAVPYAYFGATVVAWPRAGRIWAAFVALSVAFAGYYMVLDTWWSSDVIPSLEEAFANGQGFKGVGEYDPTGDDHTDLPENAPQIQVLPIKESGEALPKAEIRVVGWTAEERELSVTSSQTLKLAIRLVDYPAWRVRVNDRHVTPEHAESTAQVVLTLSPGVNKITAKFARTRDRTFGGAISLISLLFLVVVASRRQNEELPT